MWLCDINAEFEIWEGARQEPRLARTELYLFLMSQGLGLSISLNICLYLIHFIALMFIAYLHLV